MGFTRSGAVTPLEGTGYVHDESLWPVVATLIPARAFDAELVEHMRYIDGLYARRDPFLSVSFVRLSAGTTAEQRRRMSTWMADTQPLMRAYNRGSLMVSSSASLRLVLSGLMLVSPMPMPYMVVGDACDGLDWLRARAHDANMTLPEQLESGLRRLQATFDGAR